MKKIFNLIAVGMVLASVNVNAQTYVNEMTQADVERDCYIEGGSALFNDAADAYYGDGSYVQKSSASTPTAFIFNRDIWGNKNLTGFIVNVLVPNDRMDFDQFIKIEYSTDELNYQEVPDMKVEKSYDAVLGNNYWIDVWYQGALPEGVKEIKVTMVANEEVANWIPCYRRTEIFYEGGDSYEYVKPPYLMIVPTEFSVDFETENYSIDMAGSQNASSTIEVVDNPKKDAVNGSDKVLKIVQDPTDPNWGWDNADWFGVAIGLLSGEEEQLTEITETDGRYLHFSILRNENSVFGMETWGGTCSYKNQEIPFTGSENWQEVVIDLEEYIGSTFKQFYFSPNEKFGTDNVSVAETTYLDNIYISDVATSSGIADNVVSTSNVWGGKGALYVEGEAGEMSVYSVSGMEIGKYALNGFLQIDIERGIYLVKIGDTMSKIVVY